MITYEEERTEEQKEIDADVLERVQRGLKWLEKNYGPGWEDKIDLDFLSIASGYQCILGQVYADRAEDGSTGYDYAHYHFFGGDGWYESEKEHAAYLKEADLGFNSASVPLGDDWQKLTEAWNYVLDPRITQG